MKDIHSSFVASLYFLQHEMTDVNGNAVDAFVYDGTTYLPARAISEANGNIVSWDGEAGRVDITSSGSDSENPNAAHVAAEEDKYYTFELSENVNRTHVTYKNRYGIELSADLYTSADLKTLDEEDNNVTVTVNGHEFSAVLYDNETARAFKAMLPMTVTMNELNGNEKYYYFDSALPADSTRPGTVREGDLMLYGSSCLVLFYETFQTSYSYTGIGYIDDTSGLQAALGGGNCKVKYASR